MLLLLALGSTVSRVATATQPAWPWPVPTDPAAITGTFMESRETRFHTGLDVRTAGQTGWPVISPVAGHVARLRCSARGYGLALYIADGAGHTVLFAHLDRFFAPAAERLAAAQSASGQYEQDLHFAPGEIPVSREQVVALSGETGTGAPHVHVEVRDAAQRVLNPADFFDVPDSIAPTIGALRLVAADPDAPLSRTVDGNGERVAARGQWIVEVLASDRTGYAPFPVAPRAVSLFVDGTLRYRLSNDVLAFSESRQMRLDQRPGRGGRWYRMQRRQGSTLPGRSGPGGLVTVSDRPVELRIVVEDAKGLRAGFGCVLLPEQPSRAVQGTSLRVEGPLLIAELAGSGEMPPLVEGPDGHHLLEAVDGGWRVGVEHRALADGLYKLLQRGEERASLELRFPAGGIDGGGGDGAPELLPAPGTWPGGALELRRTRIIPGAGLQAIGDALELVGHGFVPATALRFAASGPEYSLLMRHDGKGFKPMDVVEAGQASCDAFGTVALLLDTEPPSIGELDLDPATGRVLVHYRGPTESHGVPLPQWQPLQLSVLDLGSGLPETGPLVLLDGKRWPVRYDGERERLLLDWFVAPQPGLHSLEVIATDLAGRQSSRSFELEFRR